MEELEPKASIAEKSLPEGLFKAIAHIFSQDLAGVCLVGGTALAGFYAAHRRSADIDLFVADEIFHKQAVLAVKSLERIGGRLIETASASKQYYQSLYELNGHKFTIDIVVDSNFHREFKPIQVNNIAVAPLKALLAMKVATIVSRCSEKDLYDLIWLFDHFRDLSLEEKLNLGAAIDGGVTKKNLLMSLESTESQKSSCDFGLDKNISTNDIYAAILKFKKYLISEITNLKSADSVPVILGKAILGKQSKAFRRAVSFNHEPMKTTDCVPPGCSNGPKRKRRCAVHSRKSLESPLKNGH